MKKIIVLQNLEDNNLISRSEKVALNGGPGSGNFNPGHGRGVGKPGNRTKSTKDKKYASVREHYDYLEKLTDWNDNELQKTIGYFGSFENTQKVQDYLKGGEDSYLEGGYYGSPMASNVVEGFKEKMSKTTFPEDTILYRGMYIRKDKIERLENNGFQSPVFQSTSLNGSTATGIIEEYKNSGKFDNESYQAVALKITAKKGQHFASSYHPGEYEIVLPPNIRYKILNKKTNSSGMLIYEVEYDEE